MAVPKPIRNSAGTYSGESTLHMSWMPEGQQQDKDKSKLHIEFDKHTSFATVNYSWHYKGEEQEGLILIAANDEGQTEMGLSDSWHLSGAVMHLSGKASDTSINCKGSYKVSDHPDWGWRLLIETQKDRVLMKMYNISPEGEEEIAVEA